jgi:hypothetical protein
MKITYTYKNGDVRVAGIGRVTRAQYDETAAKIDALNERARQYDEERVARIREYGQISDRAYRLMWAGN